MGYHKYATAAQQVREARIEYKCLYRLHRDAGKCVACHGDSGGSMLCRTCAAKDATAKRRRRMVGYEPQERARYTDEERARRQKLQHSDRYYKCIDAGLCWKCKKPRDGASTTLCTACAEKRREYMRNYYYARHAERGRGCADRQGDAGTEIAAENRGDEV